MASCDLRVRVLTCALALLVPACVGGSGPTDDAGDGDVGRRPDAVTSDAPAADAARRDADEDARVVRDGGPPRSASCPAGAILCESFEEGSALDVARWEVRADDGVMVLDDAVGAADGSRSLHMRYGRPYGALGEQAIVTREGIAAPTDRVYVRTYLRFESLALPGAHPFFVTAFDGDAWLAFGSIGNDFALMSVGNGLDNPQTWNEDPTGAWHPGVENGDDTPLEEHGLRAGEWFCVEVMAFGGGTDPSTERATVAIDGVPIADMVASDERWDFPSAPRWSPVYDGTPWAFGLESFGPDEVALDIWFDAIVIANEPIGCLP
jgi:hypothetical protein